MREALLVAALARVRAALSNPLRGDEALPTLPDLVESRLGRIVETFDLSEFERDVLVLCAGMEVEGDFPALCAARGEGRPYPTPALALEALEGGRWSALAPGAPLRYWRLIQIEEGPSLMGSPIRIDERILHLMLGTDDGLAGNVERIDPETMLLPSEGKVAERIAQLWAGSEGPLPAVHLTGTAEPSLRQIAAHAARNAGLRLLSFPTAPEPSALVREVEREMRIAGGALLLDRQTASLASHIKGPVVLVGDECPSSWTTVRVEVAKPSAEEQSTLWRSLLGLREEEAYEDVQALVGLFDLGSEEIRTAASTAGSDGDAGSRIARAWTACRDRARPALAALGRRVPTEATWDDLVLPPSHINLLQEIAQQVRRGGHVHNEWGFGERSGRGMIAHFWGASGTGKSTAAEVLAHSLNLDLVRVDLGRLLGSGAEGLWEAAKGSGAVLLFEGCEALFGSQDETTRGLWRRIEERRGLTILETGSPALSRRARFRLEFPFPDPAARAEIWRRSFPETAPTERMDYERLGRLDVAGGDIQGIALRAALLAATESRPIGMAHVLRVVASGEPGCSVGENATQG